MSKNTPKRRTDEYENITPDKAYVKEGDMIVFDTETINIRAGRVVPGWDGNRLLVDSLIQGRSLLYLDASDLRVHTVLRLKPPVIPKPTQSGLYRVYFIDGSALMMNCINQTWYQLDMLRNDLVRLDNYDLETVSSYELIEAAE